MSVVRVPRAPRFPMDVPLRYRRAGATVWSEGRTLNISASGVLFQAEKPLLEPHTAVELLLLFSALDGDHRPADVRCEGRIVRGVALPEAREPPAMAAAIQEYRFVAVKDRMLD
jgi:hypothetical protein